MENTVSVIKSPSNSDEPDVDALELLVKIGYAGKRRSITWTSYLEKQGIQISMDGKGRAIDNAWIEQFGWPLK